MKIFGSTPHPEVAYNAAPIAPVQPAIQVVPKPAAEAVKGLQLSGNLERDVFVRSQSKAEQSPFMPPERALWQITALTPPALRQQIVQKMASGQRSDLADVASWLSAAQQHGKIQFAKRDNAELNFGKALREGMDALRGDDIPLSAISLNRARRQIHDFKNLSPAPTEPLPSANPFVLHY